MKGWDEECDGRCVPLAVRVEAGRAGDVQLKAGGHVVLTVFGGQSPVMLTVEPLKGGPHNDGTAGL
jgi:hypothetical protein